ncbi:MAG: phosphoenolpyruvate synthase [Actinomycetota bacterium]|nr:phosphoenolpyruvate synthase [Actinomycetota bacterium]
MGNDYVRWFSDLTSEDVAVVGGKNASLGEMMRNLSRAGIRVPDGFATTADAYWRFLDHNDLRRRIAEEIDRLHEGAPLVEVGKAIRDHLLKAEIPADVAVEVTRAYRELAAAAGLPNLSVAVRSSATAEDLPEASFAGQQESFLNIRGKAALLDASRRCYASLFTDRAISYREHQGFDHRSIALSVGVQRMVRSDLAGAGVMFSIDTETGFPNTVIIDAAWGLGEAVVGGKVDPDEYVVFKPLLGRDGLRPIISKIRGSKRHKIVYADDSDAGRHTTRMQETSDRERASYVLSDDEILALAQWGSQIEAHYRRPMDIEWAKDGETGVLFIVQARPETVQARRESSQLRSYRLKGQGRELVRGLAIGDAIAGAPVCKLESPAEIDRFRTGSVLVTGITDPDWEPIMKRAAAIVTDHGGRTSHAAIVSRELGVPAIVGTGDATTVLADGQEVTVSCAEGDEGRVYEGILEFEQEELDLGDVPETETKVMLNLANPAAAFRWWRLPADGVGLARIEFIVNNQLMIHPMALVHGDELNDEKAKRRIAELTAGYENPTEFFVENLAYGVARIAASRYPDPVIVRLSDFKTNEYARLIGGEQFEPDEENPMIGWRGASRYYSEGYRAGFALECLAVRRVRDEMGMTNVVLMIPFCRTLKEADNVLEVLESQGLVRGRNGLQVYVMAEIPANVILAEDFADRFDGFSIGSNDLTQLILGVDRDSEALAHLFNEDDPAVTTSVERLIKTAQTKGVKVGLCGQRPSDDPEYAAFLVRAGIDSISVTPDSFLAVKEHVAAAERSLGRPGPPAPGLTG